MKIYPAISIWLISLFTFAGLISTSQDAPVTTCGDAAVAAQGNFSVPVSVTDFANIGAISLTLEYDYSVVQFVQGAPHPQLANFVTGDADLGNGFHRVSMGWFGSATSLADGSVIMTLIFNYTAGNTSLAWYDDGPSCQYADGNYTILNDLPTSAFYINGSVCALVGATGPITGADSVCKGVQGVPYSVSQVPDATGYTWAVPAGATIISGQGTNSIFVDYASNAMSGLVTVFGFNDCGAGPAAQLPVTVNDLPLADAGEDFSISYGTSTTLQAASGGSGTYGYHWSPEDLLVDPDMQNPQTVILTLTTIFTLQVTDLSTLCQSTDQAVVTVTGGPLSVNPLAAPESICAGGSAQLHANAGGGSGNYTYLWTCIPPGSPPWSSNLPDPVVAPDSSKQFQVVVVDGFTSVNGTADLQVNQLPTATISGGDTLCGYGLTTLLVIELTGTPPWNFTYSYGNTSVFVYNQPTSPYSIIAGDPGTYTVTYIEDANCTGLSFGSAAVSVFPVPAAPEISIEGLVLTSSACCGNQWYMDGEPIPGATGQSHTATQSGGYYDVVTLNGCSSEPSETIGVVVGFPEQVAAGILVYPNPAADKIFITSPLQDLCLQSVSLFSADGRLIKEADVRGHDGNSPLTLDILNLPPGIYYLKVVSKSSILVRKLMIR